MVEAVALVGIIAAGVAALARRWGLVVFFLFGGGMLAVAVADPGATVVPLGRYVWDAALEAAGL